ncbi:MAG: SigB/SigF/SigG family RNA polymerase sigma factor [Actinomycetota bacterium]
MSSEHGDIGDELARFEAYRASGDIELRNALVERHTSLAYAFARRYVRKGVSQDDLEQVAVLALIGAVERFDATLGIRFSTFAGRTIDGELKRHFRDRAWSVRVPRRQQELGLAVRSAIDTLSKELGRSPTIPELAQSVGVELDEVLAAMEATQAFRADSLDAPVDDGSAQTRGDAIASIDPGPLALENQSAVAGLLAALPERERRIVELRFFQEMSQREIAAEMEMSQMHVSRLLRSALVTLRSVAGSEVMGGP